MKRSTVVVNVGRGATIDQTALCQMLRNNELAGAGLDVFENEPLDGRPPDSIVQLANLPNVVAAPHVGSNTLEASIRLGNELIANLRSCLDGKPQNIVN
jgi:phosphoglycerate dehydrogenase-like enzyme